MTARQLGSALLKTPIDRALYGELMAFLDGPAWRACDELDALVGGKPASAADRIAKVLRGDDLGVEVSE